MQVAGAALIAAGLAIGLAALVLLHALPTGLSPLRNAVSQYGITEYRGAYRIQTLAYATAGVGAAVGVAGLPGSAGIVVALCATFAIARALISWFPMDAPAADRTPTGSRHAVLAVAAFVAAGLASRELARLLDQDKIHGGIAAANGVLSLLMGLCLLSMVVARRTRYFGGVERAFYVCMTAWLAIVGILICLPDS
ncbi:MAG: DUF998 domain-containing protein [Actinomycetota bacterium]|nr:DUF998 domain-containing protein [Actinomycetota bacterium]